MATGQAISAFALRDRDVSSQLEYLVEQEAKRHAKHGLLHALSRTKSFFQNLSMGQLSSGVSFVAHIAAKQMRKWFAYLQKEFCDYFEIDFEPIKEAGSDGDPEEHEEEPDPESVAEGQEDSTPSSPAHTSQSQRVSNQSAGSSKAGAGAGGAFGSNLDGFQSVGESKQDDVIGFHDDFR